MANDQKIRTAIRKIAGGPKNVTQSDIDWVVNRLHDLGFTVERTSNDHGCVYSIDSVRFDICTHHRGSKNIKQCYVRNFLDAMSDLGLYED